MLLKLKSSGDEVKSLQQKLQKLGLYSDDIDGDFGHKTEESVIEFQIANQLLADGIVGTLTLKKIDEKVAAATIVVKPSASPGLLKIVKVPADKYLDGYDSFSIREDVAAKYNVAFNEIKEKGGIVTSAGGLRGLDAPAGVSRSTCSFHYTGRAIDLALPSALANPNKDPYVCTLDDQRWTLHCRVSKEKEHLVPVIQLQAYTRAHTREVVTGHFLNLTEVFVKNGFMPIRPRRGFFVKNIYTSAEWWHFQNVDGLVHGVSTFGDELLKIYDEKRAKKFIYWNDVKDFKFGQEWV